MGVILKGIPGKEYDVFVERCYVHFPVPEEPETRLIWLGALPRMLASGDIPDSLQDILQAYMDLCAPCRYPDAVYDYQYKKWLDMSTTEEQDFEFFIEFCRGKNDC